MAAGDDGMEQGGRTLPSAVDWSNLPDDLLGMIRWRVVPPRGRVRFAAICRSWRAAAAPPALPLLLLSVHNGSSAATKKHLYCPEEGGVLRVRIPDKLRNMRFCGSYHGGWMAAITVTEPFTFAIVNLFSGVEVPLSSEQSNIPWLQRPWFIWKTIFSDVPTSSGCILATMTVQRNIQLCRVGCPDAGWVVIETCDRVVLKDIVFFQGGLYGLTHNGENLFKFDINVDEDGVPVVTAVHQFDVQWHGPRIESRFSTYIFELHGELAMAVMALSLQSHKPFFKVFQLDVEDAQNYKWMEVSTLGDSALFLGEKCSSRVVRAQAGGRGGVKKNHVYYSNNWYAIFADAPKFDNGAYLTRSEHGDFMCCWQDEKSHGSGDSVEGIIPSVGYYITTGMDFALWCFPPDF